MAKTSSYQKRKENIRYLSQCVKELEDICFHVYKISKLKKLPLIGAGIAGDGFITPYNNGEFVLDLLTKTNK